MTSSGNYVKLRLDSTVFRSYDVNDLRRDRLFKAFSGTDTTRVFKGTYSGNQNNAFGGIATDEIYLIKAECLARTGNTVAAMQVVNMLYQKRWRSTATFQPLTAANATEALAKILLERRKELPMRMGLRWTDLRRLNPGITLKRILNNQVFELPPNDLRYTFLIPQVVIDNSKIQQNPR